jgi:signal transduction histidine kinase
MSPEIQDKIFDLGAKHSTLGTNREKGTGLGLILCKEFVEQNHGTITVESKVGEGTTFRFTLPKHQEQ